MFFIYFIQLLYVSHARGLLGKKKKVILKENNTQNLCQHIQVDVIDCVAKVEQEM